MYRQNMSYGGKELSDAIKVTAREAAKVFGRQLREYRERVLELSQEETAKVLSQNIINGGVSTSTLKRMEAGDPSVSLRSWLAAWEMTGMLPQIVDAAEPEAEVFSSLMSEAINDVTP